MTKWQGDIVLFVLGMIFGALLVVASLLRDILEVLQ